jgi:ABC-type dipeptide/oligopeptide/nickel transport system permease subunit
VLPVGERLTVVATHPDAFYLIFIPLFAILSLVIAFSLTGMIFSDRIVPKDDSPEALPPAV